MKYGALLQRWRSFTMSSPIVRSSAYRRGWLPTRLSDSLLRSLGKREKQFIAVWIVDLDYVVAPPGVVARNRALDEFTAKLRKPIHGQLDEQTRLVCARGILA